MRLQPGTSLQGGRYRIIDVLGQGGFGITYLAEQVNLHRKVCIKEFFPKDYYKRDEDSVSISLLSDSFEENMSRFKAKFVKEAQTIATLNHANIIPIYDIFEENGTAYYVMDYIDGESLSSIVKESGALSEDVAVDYIKQVASALEHIHERTINHLDVKPGNIMVRSKDNRAILIDFGLSKHYDATSGEATSTTPVGVSHGFAPMEQYRPGGVSTFSPETDIYSLGATLYYLVTGCVPPQAAAIVDDGLPELPAHLSANVRNAIERSMEIQRKRRPHSMDEFVALLGDGNTAPTAPVVNNVAATAAPSVGDESTRFGAPLNDESTKFAEAPKAAPAEKEAAEPKKEWTPKYGANKPQTSENETSKKRKSLWWLWCLLLLFIVVLCISLKDLFRGGDNAKEVAKEEKRVAMPAVEVVTTPAESEIEVVIEEGVGECCEDSAPEIEDVFWEGTEDEVLPEISTTYKIGDYYNENDKQGVVFEVSDDGRHGKIVSLDETGTSWVGADYWCQNKGKGWYLPDRDELKAIYNNKSKIDFTLAKYGTELEIYGYYWSSTEDGEFRAWSVYMLGGDADYNNKDLYLLVRAVSAF